MPVWRVLSAGAGVTTRHRPTVTPGSRAAEMIRLLDLAADYTDPNPGRSHINGRQHALRVAHLAGQIDREMGFVGLVHDLARPLTDTYHGETIAEIVRDRVSDRAYTILRTHGAYQADAVHSRTRQRHAGPHHQLALRFAGAEQRSFSVSSPALTLADAVAVIYQWLDG